MIVLLTLVGTALLTLGGLYITCLTGSRLNNNILLGVSLPAHALTDKNLIELVKKYRRAYSLQSIIFLVLIVPLLFMGEHYNLATAYFFLWFVVLLVLQIRTVNTYFTKLYSMKTENKWWVGESHSITIDTAVSRQKDLFVLSKIWFLLPLGVLLVPIVDSLLQNRETVLWTFIGTGIIMWVIFFILYIALGKMRTKTYCTDTETNLDLNHTFKNQWSKYLILLSTLTSLFFVAILYTVEIENVTATTILAISYGILAIVFTVLPYNKIRNERNSLIKVENEDIDVDRSDDKYWLGGILYNNPNDKSFLVEKRIGIGMTMNIGSLAGKLVLVGIVLFIIGTVVLSLWAAL